MKDKGEKEPAATTATSTAKAQKPVSATSSAPIDTSSELKSVAPADSQGALGSSSGKLRVSGSPAPVYEGVDEDSLVNYLSDMKRGKAVRFLPEAIGLDLNALMKDWGVEQTESGAISAAILGAYSCVPGHNQLVQAPNLDEFTLVVRQKDGTAEIINESNYGEEPYNADKTWFAAVEANFGRAIGWIYDLAACDQVRPISSDNIGNYFKAQGASKVDVKLIDKVVKVASSESPKIIASDTLRAKLSDASFVRYHTTFASTPGLVKRAIENLGPNATKIFFQGDIAAVEAALEEYWDEDLSRAISNHAIACAYCFLSAGDMLPKDWYQGRRAISAMSVQVTSGMTRFFKRYLSFVDSSEGMERATSTEELFEAASELFPEGMRAIEAARAEGESE